VAIRIPDKKITQNLLESLDFPLVAPSANPFGYISPTSAQHVDDQLGNKIPYILDGGECSIGIESTIIGFENDDIVIHRLGGISVEEIEAVVGKVFTKTHSSSNPKAPGMLENHYSPTLPIFLGGVSELKEKYFDKKIGILSYQKDWGNHTQKILAPDEKLKTATKNLFSHLRWLDKQPIDIIIAERAPNHGLGLAINDRLERAATKKV
jgi:L-threonylcarbamoyladenylate synthase